MFHQSKLTSMDEMIGNIAHQLKQPLNTLSLHLFTIEKKYKSDSINEVNISKFIDLARSTIQNMSNSIDEFRNFFSYQKEKTHFSLNHTIEKTLTFIKDTFKSHNIIINIDLHNDILIYGYENEFAQVLLNILNNSKDAIIKNGVENGKITITLIHTSSLITIMIIDNGGGASQEILDRAFEPYFTTKEKKEGTGIGLYMSKMIVENSMNGTIRMEFHQKGMKTTIILKEESHA